MNEIFHNGISLFNNCECFQCHEVLEEAWTKVVGPRRLFFQALIHFAVGFYHCERANPAGARSQLKKGIHKLVLYLSSCENIDTARLHRDALAALERIEAGADTSIYPKIHFCEPTRTTSPKPAKSSRAGLGDKMKLKVAGGGKIHASAHAPIHDSGR